MNQEITADNFKAAEGAASTSPEEYAVRVDLAAMFRLTDDGQIVGACFADVGCQAHVARSC